MIQIIHPKELKQILSIDEIKLFKKLQKIISEINKITNLTRLIDGDEYWISQVYDSIWPFLKHSGKIFDGKKFIVCPRRILPKPLLSTRQENQLVWPVPAAFWITFSPAPPRNGTGSDLAYFSFFVSGLWLAPSARACLTPCY